MAPSTRRSASGPRSSPARGKQSTLSFNHRVTKPVPKPAKINDLATPTKPSPLSKHVQSATDLSKEEEEEAAVAVDDNVVTKPVEEIEVEEEEEPVVVKSAAELRAEKIIDRDIDKYWRNLEKERVAKRVHQGDLSTGEKVLRYFDVSSQYGPCVGIDRSKRWQRAERLGLSPPIEVLAVLLKEEKKGKKEVIKGYQMAHLDQILNSTAIGST
ncbi:DNA polymerase delta, subunit 4-domain-containing protein [Pseudomassariella vexata]|uniref:DNA polymerase delta, subunit 4-domain-containing protein n=1 Tax=Pseudomassariella vexata TaxID=1141098 RepID=A0A1Y2DCI5_9PEZI|nr:DNA polymerase delta, subunit 4-domain-containing protein [Pseudomassariella vexata]ORY56980.1 DNA polymerase delta, subunit 4-domain-containing protein [Pseudomassariella vexata]